MKNDPVLYEESNLIGLITINRPDYRNSMDMEVLGSFNEIINAVKSNRNIRCLIITGSGYIFCSGADFNKGFGNPEGRQIHEILLSAYKPFLAIGELEIPTIAAMNGHAIGGGLGLALMCDIRVANKESRYGANFTRLGLHSGMAISYILPRLVGLPVANELLFTGRIITGEKAELIGLANYAVDKDEVLSKSMELANEISESAPAAVKMIKRSIYRGLDWNPVKIAEMESLCQARTFEMKDAKEGITAFLEKRKPNFSGK